MVLSAMHHDASNNTFFLRAGIILFGTVMVAMVWGLALNQMRETRRSILFGLHRQEANLASIVAANLSQMLDQGKATALLANGLLKGHRKDSFADLTGLLAGGRAYNRAALYDAQGRLVYQSSRRSDLRIGPQAVRQALAAQVAGGQDLVLCELFKNRQTPWQVPLLFLLRNGDDLLGGLLLELDLGYILNLFKDLDCGRTGKITIHTHLGKELARIARGGLVIDPRGGMDIPAEATPEIEAGSGLHAIHYGNYHLSFRRLAPYPFIVTVGQDASETLAPYKKRTRLQLWFLGTVTLVVLAGLWGLLRLIYSKEQYLKALTKSDAANSQLIEKLEQEHKKAITAASFDPLSNLYNRRMFMILAQNSLLLARRNRSLYAVLFIDLDRFKTINDTLGHRVGDLLLKAVGTRLSGCVRGSDIVSRFGGDEFVIMLTDMPTDADIAPIVEKIIRTVSFPYENLDGHQVHTSPSVGVSIYPQDGDTLDALMRNADSAMYNAKRSGRGRYCFFDASLNTVSTQSFELEQRMPKAIADNEFVLHFQPKIALEDYRMVGLEALVRWQHPVYQLIYPGDFIDSAEATGLIVDLGRWVLEAACRQLAAWRGEGCAVVPVAVNVSPTELREADFAANFFRILERYGLQPNDIEIEITENAFIEDKQRVTDNLNTLSEGGVRITLDDFGNGFSSLSHVRSLPVQALKIDRSFIRDIRGSRHDNVIVASTITLAKKLDLTVIAEGVESHDQVVHLRMAGCEQVQGYYFSRPVPDQEIRAFFTSPIRIPAS